MPETETLERLARWRHLIEPVLRESVTPVTWEDFVNRPLFVYDGANSVVVAFDGRVYERPSRVIWVAAGELGEVAELLERSEQDALKNGISLMSYMGRRGWVRAAGYREVGVFGVKELRHE